MKLIPLFVQDNYLWLPRLEAILVTRHQPDPRPRPEASKPALSGNTRGCSEDETGCTNLKFSTTAAGGHIQLIHYTQQCAHKRSPAGPVAASAAMRPWKNESR